VFYSFLTVFYSFLGAKNVDIKPFLRPDNYYKYYNYLKDHNNSNKPPLRPLCVTASILTEISFGVAVIPAAKACIIWLHKIGLPFPENRKRQP